MDPVFNEKRVKIERKKVKYVTYFLSDLRLFWLISKFRDQVNQNVGRADKRSQKKEADMREKERREENANSIRVPMSSLGRSAECFGQSREKIEKRRP